MTAPEQKPGIFNLDWKKVVNRLTILISVGVLINVLIVYFISGEFKLENLLAFNPWFLLLSLFFGVLPMFWHAVEILIWARYFDLKLHPVDAFRISVSTVLGSAVTPTMLGGGPVKWGLLVHYGLRSGQAAAVVTFAGLQDLVFLLGMIAVSVLLSDRIGPEVFSQIFEKFSGKAPTVALIGAGIVLLLALLVYLLGRTEFGRKFRRKLLDSYGDFRDAYKLLAAHGKWYFLAATTATTFRWLSRFLVVLTLAAGLSIDTDYTELMVSQWMVYSSMTAMPTPGAAGGAEAVFYLVYKNYIPKELIGVLIFAWRFFTEYMRLIFAAVMVNFFQRKN